MTTLVLAVATAAGGGDSNGAARGGGNDGGGVRTSSKPEMDEAAYEALRDPALARTVGLRKERAMQHEKWVCPKCGNRDFEADKFAATGGGFAKIFDVQNKKFSTVSCTRCSFTEIYRSSTSALGNVFDFFTG